MKSKNINCSFKNQMEILELSIWNFKIHWLGLKISVEKEHEIEYKSIEIVNLKEKRGKRWHRKKDNSHRDP